MQNYLFLIFILALSFLIVSNKTLSSKLRFPERIPKLFYVLLSVIIVWFLGLYCGAILFMR